jgi:hypothetical protein
MWTNETADHVIDDRVRKAEIRKKIRYHQSGTVFFSAPLKERPDYCLKKIDLMQQTDVGNWYVISQTRDFPYSRSAPRRERASPHDG